MLVNFLSTRLYELRQSAGLEQVDIAKIINKSKYTVSDMERGKNSGPLSSWLILANYFNVSLDYLLGREDGPKRKTLMEQFLDLPPEERRKFIVEAVKHM
jgi:transcriptional regulator with XRE-family HTH domain